jgi:hypothetical protein
MPPDEKIGAQTAARVALLDEEVASFEKRVGIQ